MDKTMTDHLIVGGYWTAWVLLILHSALPHL